MVRSWTVGKDGINSLGLILHRVASEKTTHLFDHSFVDTLQISISLGGRHLVMERIDHTAPAALNVSGSIPKQS